MSGTGRTTMAWGAALALASVLAACEGTSSSDSSSGSGTELDSLRMVVPADPGGGWDLTARSAQQAMESEDIVPEVEVTNVPNAGGIVGLSQLIGAAGEGDLTMVMGLVMLGAIETSDSDVSLDQTTPIARLADEYEVIVVPADSPYKSLDDLVQDMTADPGSVSIAGGSAGGTDQILAGLIAQDVGVAATDINYVAFSGGGAAIAAILGGKVSAGISGYSEFAPQIDAGKMRALGISAPEPLEGVDVPTLKEGGVDVTLSNWRGVVAPPEITDDQRQTLIDAFEEVRDSETWTKTLEQNYWRDTWLPGDDFGEYITTEEERVSGILSELGLT